MIKMNLTKTLLIFLISSFQAMAQYNGDMKIPFTDLSHHILVHAKIDSSESSFNFIIDTGGATFVDIDVVKQLGLKEQGPMAKISTLDLSGNLIKNVFCFTTFNFDIFRPAGTPIHGIIGSNLMERYKVTFDYQANIVTFSEDTAALQPLDDELYFTFRNHPINNAPIIKIKVNQDTIEGMIDTGQPYPVVLPLNYFEHFEKSDNTGLIRSKGVMIKWPQTAPDHNYLARLTSCEIGNMKLTDVICVFAELPPLLSMPLIGADLLSQYTMIINYPKDEMVLIPVPDIHFVDNIYSAGVNLNISEGGEIFVEGIWEGSPADEANIQAGDQVVSFDSTMTTPENLHELMQLLHDDEAKSITLEMKNNNGSRHITLHKKMLF